MPTHARKHGLLMRVFWPSDAPRDDIPGVLVGWRNSELDVLVVGVLQGVESRNVDFALRMRHIFRGSPHPIENIYNGCGGQPIQVLGTLNARDEALPFDPKMLAAHSIPRSKGPRIDCSADAGVNIQIVVFDKPDPKRMQYLSLTPMSLALADKEHAFDSVAPFDGLDKEEEAEQKRKVKLAEKLKKHTIIKHPRTEKEMGLGTIINQINCSAEVDALMQKNIGLVGIRQKRTLSVSERVVESATNLWDFVLLWLKQAFRHHIWPIASQIFILALLAHRIVAEALLRLLDWRLHPNAAALKDVSATAQQVDIRLQQFCYWPAQYATLHRRRGDWESTTNSHPEYIRFFNSLWLVANDVIIGLAVGSYIIENADLVATQMDDLINTYSISGLQRMITWLMDWPAGLKLNNELAVFLGDLFLWVIDYWANSMSHLRPALPAVIRLIGYSSLAGASLPISLFSDLLSLLTLHISCFYIAAARIYNWQLTIIISLFHLFRGKKRNVLRNRIDRCDYDLDQLLLGTILFTLLWFLLPTIAVFYATFAGARTAILALKAALDAWLAVLNHFPLFALMLRLKDPLRLPGGVRFELSPTHTKYPSPAKKHHSSEASSPSPAPAAASATVLLHPIPLPLPLIFTQYRHLTARLRAHYASPRVLLGLVSGQFVPPIRRKSLYSLQYSMLPVKRVGVGELWGVLVGEEGGGVGGEKGGVADGRGGGGGRSRRGKAGEGARERGEGYWWSR